MASDLILTKVNEAWLRVEGDMGIARELSEHLTFEVPGAKFSPKYKSRVWDGKIRLLNLKTQQIYLGLVPYVKKFCKDAGYTVEYLEEEINTPLDTKNIANSLSLPMDDAVPEALRRVAAERR
mgnify:CR=1 FL=1